MIRQAAWDHSISSLKMCAPRRSYQGQAHTPPPDHSRLRSNHHCSGCPVLWKGMFFNCSWTAPLGKDCLDRHPVRSGAAPGPVQLVCLTRATDSCYCHKLNYIQCLTTHSCWWTNGIQLFCVIWQAVLCQPNISTAGDFGILDIKVRWVGNIVLSQD